MFKSAFEFVETYDTTLSRRMTGLKLDRAKCEFKFCHLGALWPFMGLMLPRLAGCDY